MATSGNFAYYNRALASLNKTNPAHSIEFNSGDNVLMTCVVMLALGGVALSFSFSSRPLRIGSAVLVTGAHSRLWGSLRCGKIAPVREQLTDTTETMNKIIRKRNLWTLQNETQKINVESAAKSCREKCDQANTVIQCVTDTIDAYREKIVVKHKKWDQKIAGGEENANLGKQILTDLEAKLEEQAFKVPELPVLSQFPPFKVRLLQPNECPSDHPGIIQEDLVANNAALTRKVAWIALSAAAIFAYPLVSPLIGFRLAMLTQLMVGSVMRFTSIGSLSTAAVNQTLAQAYTEQENARVLHEGYLKHAKERIEAYEAEKEKLTPLIPKGFVGLNGQTFPCIATSQVDQAVVHVITEHIRSVTSNGNPQAQNTLVDNLTDCIL